MSRESLYSKHLKLIQNDPSQWTDEEREEKGRLDSLKMPPLPERKSWWARYREQIQWGLGSAVACSLAIAVFLPHFFAPTDRLTPKGTARISVYWERNNVIRPLQETTQLSDGDKIGAGVISNEPAVAIWAILDRQQNLLTPPSDIRESAIPLEPGVERSFGSSFQLTAPNQGEILVVVVCPRREDVADPELAVALLQRKDLLLSLSDQKRYEAEGCLAAGFRLRSQE